LLSSPRGMLKVCTWQPSGAVLNGGVMVTVRQPKYPREKEPRLATIPPLG
jgi:hypothetical protein